MQHVYDVTFGMLQVRENEISLRIVWWSWAAAHLRGFIVKKHLPNRIIFFWIPFTQNTFLNRYCSVFKQLPLNWCRILLTTAVPYPVCIQPKIKQIPSQEPQKVSLEKSRTTIYWKYSITEENGTRSIFLTASKFPLRSASASFI